MPSDLRNSTMAKATGLTFSLFNVTSAREVLFSTPLCMQCTLHGLTMTLLHLVSLWVFSKVVEPVVGILRHIMNHADWPGILQIS